MFAHLVLILYLALTSKSALIKTKCKTGNEGYKCSKVLASTEELGKVVDLRGTDLLSDFQERERIIFKPIDQKCFLDETKSVKGSKKYMEYYASSKSFYSSLATQTQLDASLEGSYTLGVSLQVATKSKSSSENRVSGMSLNALAVTEKIVVKKGCLVSNEQAGFTDSFLKDLEGLPETVKSPWLKNSWEAYSTFLKSYGSHVINSVTLGSSFRQMTFAESSKSYSERDFEVKSCLSLSGPTEAGKAGFKACSDITKEEKSKASKISTSDKVFVLGGDPETRDKLLDQETRSVEEIQKLLGEAGTAPASIEHTFIAIWDVVKARFKSGSPNHIRGLNLEYFYLGFLNYGCPYHEYGGLPLQKFDQTRSFSATSPEFECSLAKEGCHTNDDCHYHNVKCECRGDTCVRYKSVPQDNGSKKQTAYENYDSKWYGHGCGWRRGLAGSMCDCHNHNRDQRYVVWSKPSKDAPAHKARHHDDHQKAKDPSHWEPERN